MLLQEIPSQDPVTFITMGYPAQKLNRQPIFDRALAGRLLQTIEQGHAHTDLPGAFRLARQQIKAQKRERPQQAVYLLGAEDNGLPPRVLEKCHRLVSLPSVRTNSYNVAVAGSLVMYDRVFGGK